MDDIVRGSYVRIFIPELNRASKPGIVAEARIRGRFIPVVFTKAGGLVYSDADCKDRNQYISKHWDSGLFMRHELIFISPPDHFSLSILDIIGTMEDVQALTLSDMHYTALQILAYD